MNASFPYNQAAEAVLMIRPKHFGFNPQTAETNIFQVKTDANQVSLNETAVAEFDNFVSLLHKYDVEVIVVEDQDEHKTPDSVFPNNWFTTHHDGMMVYYVMYAPVRNLEIRNDLIDILTERNFKIKGVLDLYDEEDERPGQFLEGTGSFVFDHINKIAYANISSRTHLELAGKTSEFLGYVFFPFVSLVDKREVYHTNVMLTVSENFAVVCLDCLADDEKKKMLKDKLITTGHEPVIISIEQMKKFAGNMLSVKNKKGELITVMSQTAFDALDESQLEIILKYSKILPVSIPIIETVGGGSVRCMMAEIFLPKAGTT
ncbi:MAG TPA: arginine deiminase-related protein [Bacteroidia bacterium]|nr:arginine deiminase-related protein [Bacteroidia bacterium]